MHPRQGSAAASGLPAQRTDGNKRLKVQKGGSYRLIAAGHAVPVVAIFCLSPLRTLQRAKIKNAIAAIRKVTTARRIRKDKRNYQNIAQWQAVAAADPWRGISQKRM